MDNDKIDKIMDKYPSDPSSLIQVLLEIQSENRWLSKEALEKALSINSRSTLPEHITRISLISFVYCSLETPARSAAPYAHQWHTNPNILGVNLRPVLICFHRLCYSKQYV